MYNIIYEEMVDAGITEVVDEPVFLDNDGNIVVDESKAFGRKVTHKVTRPDMFFQFDETGGDTNMKNDGHYGGTKYMGRRGTMSGLHAQRLTVILPH